jgi:hypothetical protein
MWEPLRQNLMEEHRFYVEQAQKRLLSQFDNMKAEADRAAEEHLEKMSIHFNADVYDPSDLYESAHEEGIAFYQLLSDMYENTRLSVIAGMYHQWDKKLREWIVNEMTHWHRGENAIQSIWKADFSKLMGFLLAMGFDASKKVSGYERLNALRLVVNVYKHGNGSSLDDLKKSNPEFLTNPLRDGELPLDWIDHTFLHVSDQQLEEFSVAIMNFWKAIPERIFLADELNVPEWFKNAVLNDRKKS